MENKYFKLIRKNQLGQSSVEYILFIAVIVSVVTAVIKSQPFQNIFGEEGKFSAQFRKETEYSYRHGLGGREFLPDLINYNDKHDTYLSPNGNETRFFGALEPYPEQ